VIIEYALDDGVAFPYCPDDSHPFSMTRLAKGSQIYIVSLRLDADY
jgi:hypothetical protein